MLGAVEGFRECYENTFTPWWASTCNQMGAGLNFQPSANLANTKAAWRENGLIMLHIRNSGLYKAKYGKFEQYLEKRWEISDRHGRRLIAGVEFMQKIAFCIENDSVKTEPIGSDSAINKVPENERQIRPLLTCLDTDGQRIHVWREVAQSGERITAALVQRRVDKPSRTHQNWLQAVYQVLVVQLCQWLASWRCG